MSKWIVKTRDDDQTTLYLEGWCRQLPVLTEEPSEAMVFESNKDAKCYAQFAAMIEASKLDTLRSTFRKTEPIFVVQEV